VTISLLPNFYKKIFQDWKYIQTRLMLSVLSVGLIDWIQKPS